MSVQATVLNLLLDFKQRFDLTFVFISHDLSVVRMICNRVVVMHLGRIVEVGDAAEIFARPRHPYTRALLSAIPQIGGRRVTESFTLEGEPPNPANLPSGCRFRTRCPRAEARCARDDPVLEERAPGHATACLLAD